MWSEYAAKKERQAAEEKKQKKRKPSATQTKEEAERAKGDDKDEDEDYIPSEEPSSEDHCTSQPKRSSREPTRKATSELYFYVFFLTGQKLTQYSYLFVDFNLFSYSTDRLFFSTIESSY